MKTTVKKQEEKDELISFVNVKMTEREVARVRATIDFFQWFANNRPADEVEKGFSKNAFNAAREEYLGLLGERLHGASHFDIDAYNAAKPGNLEFCTRLGLVKFTGRAYYTSIPRLWEEELYVRFKDGTKMSTSKFFSLGTVKTDVIAVHGEIVSQEISPKEKTNYTSLYKIASNDYETYMKKIYLPSAQDAINRMV